ncbi:glycogen synthase, partial [Dissulfurirhabdus thermomarina]
SGPSKAARPLRVWFLSREYRGIAGAGGVQDVTCDLAEALARAGVRVTVVLPRYGFVPAADLGFRPLDLGFDIDMNYTHEERRERVAFHALRRRGVEIVLVEADRFAEKHGVYAYTAEEEAADPTHRRGAGHYDYFAMNVLHQKAALALAVARGRAPEVFHCHDGHTATLPALMRELEGFRVFFRRSAALVTLHNAGIGYHQEIQDLPFARANTGLPWRVITGSLLNGAFDPFLAGAAYAPMNTVSENYARELQETELDALTGWLGHALRDRGVRLEGITNGINPDAFDPRRHRRLGLAAPFDPATGDLAGKAACRRRLLADLAAGRTGRAAAIGSLDTAADVPLLTAVTRLSEQKGMDILAEALEDLLVEEPDFGVLILGAGERAVEERLARLAERPEHAGRFLLLLGHDPALALKVYAAGDFFLIPSRYEPCGLTDFMAQLMGNLPVVHLTGGLVKVRDGFNGYGYAPNTPAALKAAVVRALRDHRQRPQVLDRMRRDAVRHIREHFTWERVRGRYLDLYRQALRAVAGGSGPVRRRRRP